MPTIEERLKGASPRLTILAACGFARTVEHLLADERSKNAIDVAERNADGRATTEEVQAAVREAMSVLFGRPTAGRQAALAAQQAAWAAQDAQSPRAAGCAALTAGAAKSAAKIARTAHTGKVKASAAKAAAEARNQSILDCILAPRIQATFPPHVRGLAATIYDKRDWRLMAILADALEEMGLGAFAQHCRQPIHVRGCHALDSILGLH
jgi:hypothetical protein